MGEDPFRRRLREEYLRRHGMSPPADLVQRELTVDGVVRTYWLAPSPAGGGGSPPILLGLHGAGGQGPATAALTGLDRRGPAAGFVTVFPDGVGRVWNDDREAERLAYRRGVDDVAFLRALVGSLEASGAGRGPVYLTGISNGSFMSEHLARFGFLDVAGIALVAGPGTQRARHQQPAPVRPATVLLFSGTADPLVPYAGGPIGPLGRLVNQRNAQWPDPGRGLAVAAETAAADWAAANGITGGPTVEELPFADGDVGVTRLTYSSPGRPPVVLYRVNGGGHTWPGGPAYLPERLIGRVARSLDATGILLEAFRARARELGRMT